jgi:hypothetical protein
VFSKPTQMNLNNRFVSSEPVMSLVTDRNLE